MRRVAILTLGVALATSLFAATPVQAAPLAGTASAVQLLGALTVTPSHDDGYNRANFQHWVDADSDGCDTRQEVLIAESLVPAVVGAGCSVTSGEWFSWYDGATWTNPSDVDIDHFVPLQEVWRSGAFGWTAEQRRDYANDLGIGETLVAVTDSVNSSKGGSDPAAWLPPLASARCDYAVDWVIVKFRWNLAIDTAEKAALDGLLAGTCGARAVPVPPLMATPAVGATPPVAAGTVRISGADRYATAIAISAAYAPGVGVVYVATGENYPDALSAAPAAALQGGPLLLTSRAALPEAVRREIVWLAPGKIIVVGGESAISRTAFNALAALAPTRRDAGTDRYQTSRVVTQNAFGATGAATAYVATGANFPDALSASAAAGSTGSPVILVNGAGASVDSPTSQLIAALHSQTIRIAGGTSVVSAKVAAGLKTISGVSLVQRLAGGDRYGTSVAINQAAFASSQTTYLAVGTGFADALAGAALAGRDAAPLYVVPGNCIPDAALTAMRAAGSVRTVLLGGPSALGSGVASAKPCSTIPSPAPPASPPAPPAPPAPPSPPAPPGNPGDTKNCGDFPNWRAAQDWFETYFPAYGDVARLDRNHDGIACESLPGAP